MSGPLSSAKFLAYRGEGSRVGAVAVDVVKQRTELLPRNRIEATVLFEAVFVTCLNWSRFQPALATPTTGTLRLSRFIID